MAIDYGTESSFTAPIMRIDDEGHGFKGVIFDAETRPSTDYETGKGKWFHNRQLVLSENKPAEDAVPVLDFIYHIAVERGRGAFTRRDDNGDVVKLSSGKNALDVRDVEREDVAVVFSAAWMAKAAKKARLNEGHEVRFKRTTPARDESGDRMTNVQCELEILGTVDKPTRYNQPVVSAGIDDGDFGDGEPF